MANDGKVAEEAVQEVLENLKRYYRAHFLRLYDSRSAGAGKGGNFIPKQPSDYVFMRGGRGWLLEVKSSEKHQSFKQCSLKNYVSSEQIAGARTWVRAGGLSMFVFLSIPRNTFEIWEGMDVIEAYIKGGKLTTEPLAVCDKPDLLTELERLT